MRLIPSFGYLNIFLQYWFNLFQQEIKTLPLINSPVLWNTVVVSKNCLLVVVGLLFF